jgi:hypothetical protein
MLKDAVLAHGGKNWEEITALVPGRTKSQCRNRWHETLVPNIDPATARADQWASDEDKMLKNAVPTYGGIGTQLPRWSQVERKDSVARDGVMPWILASAGRRHVRVS